MVGTVNEGLCVCWNGFWGVGGVNENDMKDGEDNFVVSLVILWFGGGLYVSMGCEAVGVRLVDFGAMVLGLDSSFGVCFCLGLGGV